MKEHENVDIQWRAQQLEDVLSDDPSMVADTLLHVSMTGYEDDPQWCLDLLNDHYESVARHGLQPLVITCIGHLARVYKTTDGRSVKRVVEGLKDPLLDGESGASYDDIISFVKIGKLKRLLDPSLFRVVKSIEARRRGGTYHNVVGSGLVSSARASRNVRSAFRKARQEKEYMEHFPRR
jgi:hypothetical protein